jgi:large subunit ribosomal protein L30
MKKAKSVRVRQIRSAIGTPRGHREALRGLGLRRLRHTVERADGPALRGMVAKIPHLVEIVEEKP